MKKTTTRKILYVIAPIACFLAICAGFMAWVYSSPQNEFKHRILSSFNLPVGTVAASPITANMVNQRILLAKRLGKNLSFNEALGMVVKRKQAEILRKNLVKENSKGFDELVYRSLRESAQKNKAYSSVSDEQFSSQIFPEYLDNLKLKIYFSSLKDTNIKSWDKAEKFVEILDSDSDFGVSMVKADIAEEGSTQVALSGDSGLVPFNSFLPEIQRSVSEKDLNTVRIVATRDGLVVIKLKTWVVSEDNEIKVEANLAQIPFSGYEEWLTAKLRSISTRVYVR